MQKFRSGNAGAYTAGYHALLGSTPWVMVRRLLSGPLTGATDEDEAPQLSEGDVATVFSQFGEVVDVRFVRHSRTGRFLGTAFVKFKDYRSGILAADELNSDPSKGENFFLSAPQELAAMKDNQRGILVERCEEAVVPPLYNAEVETYSQWLARHDVALS